MTQQIQFRDYQKIGIDQIAGKAKNKTRRMVFQLATGGGKTVTFAGLTQRFLTSINKRVVIAVHRQELLKQTVIALEKVAGIKAGMLVADHKIIVQQLENGFCIPHAGARVVVCMVETLHNRLKKYEQLLGDVGMLIVDECHIGSFNKIYTAFPHSLIIGFTATPLSANKKVPLKTFFDDIVTPASIQHLIDHGYLAKNITISVKNGVDRKKLKVRGGEFDERMMGMMFSKSKHVEECIKAYEKYAQGQKTLVFNCNIEHSKKTTDAFVNHGLNARHLDGNDTEEHRRDTLKWFAETDDAILCSVNILNTGFDEPTIRNIIVNRATMSLPMWLQMCGRGSRSIPGEKTTFKIIDLGSNVATHLDWNFDHNWREYFFNPEKAKKGNGAAPTKLCINPECEAIIHMATKFCPHCGTDNSRPPEYDKEQLELEVLTKGIDIDKLIEENKKYKPYRSLHLAKHTLVQRFKSHFKNVTCPQDVRESLNERFQLIVKDWCKQQDMPYDHKHKWMTKKWLMDELERHYGKIESNQNESVTI